MYLILFSFLLLVFKNFYFTLEYGCLTIIFSLNWKIFREWKRMIVGWMENKQDGKPIRKWEKNKEEEDKVLKDVGERSDY